MHVHLNVRWRTFLNNMESTYKKKQKTINFVLAIKNTFKSHMLINR
jgi:hypothetical protein